MSNLMTEFSLQMDAGTQGNPVISLDLGVPPNVIVAGTVKFLAFREQYLTPDIVFTQGRRGGFGGLGPKRSKLENEAIMNYMFKLSRRLSRVRATSVVVAATLFNLACTDDPSTGPTATPAGDPTRVSIIPGAVSMASRQSMQFRASVDRSSESEALESDSKVLKGRRWRRGVIDLAIAPHTVTATEGSTASFVATATLSDSTITEPVVKWAATGGTIDANGQFTAGQIPGNYAVSATTLGGVADTAAVIITENLPTVIDVELSPTSASLPAGGSKRFTVVGKSTEGTTVAVSARYSATGGIISEEGIYQAGQTPGKYQVIATDTTIGAADTSIVTIESPLPTPPPPPPPTLQAVVLSPATASLNVGANQQFAAVGKASDSSTISIDVTYSATGGTITAAGLYTAGTVPGQYRVIASDGASGLADTAGVIINTQVASVTVSPATASVVAGRTTQLTATARDENGTVLSQAPMSWVSSNTQFVTVTSLGAVTGVAPGSAVITAASGDIRAQASISVTAAPVTSSGGCPEGGYLRLVDVSTATQLSAAIAAALPGDQIRLAPGNYNYTSSGGLPITRSGTASNRIVICGPRTAIVNAYIWVKASYWHMRGFRIRGDSPARMVWGIYQTIGGNNVYDSLEVDHQSQEGINIHDGPSYNNVISNNYIHDCGQVRLNRGEGVYLGNGDTVDQIVNNTWVHHNRIVNCASEGIEVKAGTSGQIIEFNTIINAGHSGGVGSDIPIQIRGNNNIIRDNTIIGGPRYSIENFADTPTGGMNNLYERNTASGAGNNRMFSFGTNAGSPLTGNIVKCTNVASSPMVLNATCKQ